MRRRTLLATLAATSAGCMGSASGPSDHLRDVRVASVVDDVPDGFEFGVRLDPGDVTVERTAIVHVSLTNVGEEPFRVEIGYYTPFSPMYSDTRGWGLSATCVEPGTPTPPPNVSVESDPDVGYHCDKVSERCWAPKASGVFLLPAVEKSWTFDVGQTRSISLKLYSSKPDEETDCMPTGTHGFSQDYELLPMDYGPPIEEFEWGFDLEITG